MKILQNIIYDAISFRMPGDADPNALKFLRADMLNNRFDAIISTVHPPCNGGEAGQVACPYHHIERSYYLLQLKSNPYMLLWIPLTSS